MNEVWSVFVFWNRQALIHALSSLRKIEFCRSSSDRDFMQKCMQPCVAARTRNTKQGELNARWIIPTFGFLGELTWMDSHLDLLDRLGTFTPSMSVTIPNICDKDATLIPASKKAPMSPDYYQKVIYQLYTIHGVPEKLRREMNLALHGFHELFDTIATALLWSPAARTELGRWVFQVDAHGARQKTKGENKVIFARYATEVSSMIQSKLRANIIKAVRFVLLQNADWRELSMSPNLEEFVVWACLRCPGDRAAQRDRSLVYLDTKRLALRSFGPTQHAKHDLKCWLCARGLCHAQGRFSLYLRSRCIDFRQMLL